MRTGRVAWALLALAVVCALLGGLGGEGSAAFDKQKRRETMRSVVFVLAADMQGDRLVPVSSGSGTIVTGDGAVLTNHHVVFDEKVGRPHDAIAIGLLKSFDQEPEIACIAAPARSILKPELDLALVKCERDLKGKPFRASGWAALSLGDSHDLVPGDDVFVLGYPGIGGTTIHVTAGKISGFQGERGGAGRNWIKTDASITHGNSGGTAVDEDGRFIGVPSAFRLAKEEGGGTSGNVGLIRPIELAQDLVALARSGWNPGDTVAGAKPATPPPPAGDRGVTVVGRIRDSDDDKPVAGAFVVVFKPGVKVAELTRDNLGDKYLTKSVTNKAGEFVLGRPIPRGQRFTVLVYAEGYEVLAADDVLSTQGEIPDRYDPWGTVRLEPQ
jgi:S1-C subfamily serine protease